MEITSQVFELLDDIIKIFGSIEVYQSLIYRKLEQIIELTGKKDNDILSILNKKIDNDDFDFRARTINCLKDESIHYYGDLVQWTQKELYKIPNLGKKTLHEIIDQLKRFNLRLAMKNFEIVKKWQEQRHLLSGEVINK